MKALLLLAALTSCAYDVRFSDCFVHCAADGMECPDGLQCGAEGLCRTPSPTETCATVLETFPSCVGLAATCGPNADEDCCSTATPIPGGTFFRSHDVASDGMYPSMSYPATVSPFVLDRFEVTVGRFRKFVEASRGTRANPPPAGAGARFLNGAAGQGGWDPAWDGNLAANTAALIAAVKCDGTFQTWADAPGGNENRPINCITWYEAMAFCVWDSGYLPTEAESNFAAAGGDEQRAYPWSSPAGSTTIDCSYANYFINSPSGMHCTDGAVGSPNRVGSESPTGDGRFGQSDLAGNVWEWSLDWFTSLYANPCDNCTDLTPTDLRAIRGAGFLFNAATDLRAAKRFHAPPDSRGADVGFRCGHP